ncbi:S-adenosyl-L-methionine-dependent methyltransferase [Ophiobolus disseminans]|uniref:S-adenosyl-L-methionine-dependent methyltransferase n=1 Tax=Ophiobolus disseminans TaxID=1469910 RepID=A0A6A7AL96_9PLEO|nr:S-adenosyl-L-methionine-dependent methyltransferase [Ophiobolus disseminans]
MGLIQTLREKLQSWLLRRLRGAISLIQNPDEVAFSQAFEAHSHNTCLRIGIDLGVFHSIIAHGADGVSYRHLAAESGADEALIVRIMRVITAIGYAKETSSYATYAPTPLTMAITKPTIEAGFLHSTEHAAIVCSKLPSYLKSIGYQNPTDGSNGPFQHALETDLPFFKYIHDDPRKLKNFNTYQAGNRSTKMGWLDWFPVRDIILREFDPLGKAQGTLLVDMGGGTGRDITAFLNKFPQTAGFLALEDLPRVIEPLSDISPGITTLSQDLFQPQQITGAKVYYTHFLLHDFSDEQCRIILQHAAAAMTPGYSRLLLNEMILPDAGCPPFYAAADITMMCVLAAMERSESQWKALLESVNLKLVKFWYSRDKSNREGVIEAMVLV